MRLTRLPKLYLEHLMTTPLTEGAM